MNTRYTKGLSRNADGSITRKNIQSRIGRKNDPDDTIFNMLGNKMLKENYQIKIKRIFTILSDLFS